MDISEKSRLCQILLKITKKAGIDKAIFFTSSSRIVGGLGGVVSVLFIARYLTGIEQGFYYTFGSILAIQVFFELGLNGIITQYVAHEASHLTQKGDRYVGEDKYLSRMASLLHFCIKWYGILAGLLFLILSVAGYVFFSHFYKAESLVDWHLPWILLSIGTTFYFLLSPFIAFIEGLGKVKEVAKIRFGQQVTTMFVVWSGLFLGLKLFVGGVSTMIGLCILCWFFAIKFLPLLRNIYLTKITERVSYRREIFPFQWKIAISWVSGYFIFQLFNPVLFATEGAVVAGQMGMTLTVLNAILGFTLSWISTKVPLFSGLIAQKEYIKLDGLFNSTLFQSTAINFIALIGMFAVVFGIRYFNIEMGGKNLGNRFLPYIPMLFMMVPILLNHIIAALATYLRCHKREPMMIQSITLGLLCSLSTIFLSRYFGIMGMTAGYLILSILSFTWTYFIFVTKKRKWHNEYPITFNLYSNFQ